MALDTNYVVGINLNDYFVNKDTGLPLSGGTITFYHDNNRSVGKYAYMLSGSPPNYTYLPLPNPITLSSVGTITVGGTNQAVYFYPYDQDMNLDLYYIVVRDSAGNVQLVRQAWPNSAPINSPLGTSSGETDNQLMNSQFSDVLFNPDVGVTYSWTGAIVNNIFNVAPNWDLIVSASGDGSVTINRLPITGNINIATNPPYALNVLPGGVNISSITLRQTLYQNPSIWANNFLSAFMLISSLDEIDHSISMNYGTSVPDVPQTLITGNTGLSGYVAIAGIANIGASLNTDSPPDAYTFIDIILPRIGDIAITSLQVLPVIDSSTPAAYIQNSVNKENSDLFSYYNPLIQSIPVPSISEGWDFKVNPSQFGISYAATTGASNYVWDQTILWQSTDNLISAGRDIIGRLQITLNATGQFALIQYLNAQQMQLLLENGWSTLINAYTDNAIGASGTVSFYYTTASSLPVLTSGTNQSIVSTLDSNGKPSGFNGVWVELENPLLVKNQFTIPYSGNNTCSPVALNGWSRPLYGVSSAATYIAIVIGFSSLPATSIYFDSISVTPGRLAVPFAPVDYLLTLKQMNRYFEKSYKYGVNPGTITNDGCIVITPISFSWGVEFKAQPNNISITYDEKVSLTPAINIYSVLTGVLNEFDIIWYLDTIIQSSGEFVVSSYYTQLSNGKKSSIYIQNGNLSRVDIGGTYSVDNAIQTFHYTVDSRYGLF